MWQSLQPERREQALSNCPRWRKYWRAIQRKDVQLPPDKLEQLLWERKYLRTLMVRFMDVLDSVPETGDVSDEKVYKRIALSTLPL